MDGQVRRLDGRAERLHEGVEIGGRQVDDRRPDAEHDVLLGMADPVEASLLLVAERAPQRVVHDPNGLAERLLVAAQHRRQHLEAALEAAEIERLVDVDQPHGAG